MEHEICDFTIGPNGYLDHGRCLSGEAARQAAVV